MICVTPIQTGTVSIRPHHHCGEEGKGPVRRKLDMLRGILMTAMVGAEKKLESLALEFSRLKTLVARGYCSDAELSGGKARLEQAEVHLKLLRSLLER